MGHLKRRHRTNGGLDPLEIVLANDGDLVLRGFTGDELAPAVLVGEVVLNLSEATNLKELQLIFSGNANVTWRDTANHHCDHALFYHDFSFLNPSSFSTAHHSTTKTHSHTLQAGRHVFPFSLHVPGSLPASLRTYSGTCVIEYKLKAVAIRAGLAADWKLKKTIRVARGFGADAVEYNQTLEIENTWPGKVMYAFTIPHKAYAAGEKIPVSVKFSPLAKGVRIVTLVTSIREHTTVHSKSNTQHSEVRDAAVVKYHFVPEEGSNVVGVAPPPRTSTASFSNGEQATASASASGSGLAPSGAAHQGSGSSPRPAGLVDDGTDTEVDIVLDIPIPIWTAPTHVVFPVFINHKIKWSAFIKNPDGHVSELRCALPIHILAPCLAEEARLASAGSRTLLFGESGVLAHSDVPQVDLPSYQDHVRDRVANAETASNFSVGAAFISTPWSSFSTPFGSPMASPPGSRPSSPNGRHYPVPSFQANQLVPQIRNSNLSPLHHTVAPGSASGSSTPVSPAGLDPDHPEDHRNWIDSELMSTLNLDHPTTPPGSNPSSRPPSRPPSRPASPDHSASSVSVGSLAPNSEYSISRPSSITRGSTSSLTGGFFNHLHLPKPLRPLTAFSRMGSTSGSSTSIPQTSTSSTNPSPPSSSHSSHHPSASALSTALAAHAAQSGSGYPTRPSILDVHTHQSMSNSPGGGSGPHSMTTSPMSTSPTTNFHSTPFQNFGGTPSPNATGSRTPDLTDLNAEGRTLEPNSNPLVGDVDFLSLVPSYDVAVRGFLGGGVVPISTALPNYEDLGGDRA